MRISNLIALWGLVAMLSGCGMFEFKVPPDMGTPVASMRIEGTAGSALSPLKFGANVANEIIIGEIIVTERPGGFDLGLECARPYRFKFTDAASTVWAVECKAESQHTRNIKESLSDKKREGLQCTFTAAGGAVWKMGISGESMGRLSGDLGGDGTIYHTASPANVLMRTGYVFSGQEGTVAVLKRTLPPSFIVGKKLPTAHKGPVAAATAALVMYEDRTETQSKDQCIYDE